MDNRKKYSIIISFIYLALLLAGAIRIFANLLRRYGYCLLFANMVFMPNAFAAPAGGNIVGGAGSIGQSGLTTTINQNTSSLAIDWNSFNINSDEIVNYIQPSSSSIALNNILGSQASQIFGQINANGQIVLVNPNGIFFSQNASINVGGLIASGLGISTSDFMNGDYIFNEVLGTDGTVVNSGLINASLGGNVTLLGKQVTNEGVHALREPVVPYTTRLAYGNSSLSTENTILLE